MIFGSKSLHKNTKIIKNSKSGCFFSITKLHLNSLGKGRGPKPPNAKHG